MFENNLDWRGLLIEPNPLNSRKLGNSGRKNSLFAPMCMGRRSETVSITVEGGAVATVIEQTSESFLLKHHSKTKAHQVSIKCTRMQDILDMAGLVDIDLLSVDVEGGEEIVLRTLDFNRTNIYVVVLNLTGTIKIRTIVCVRCLARTDLFTQTLL